MTEILSFYLIPFLIIVAILIGVLFLAYWIPKRLGKKKLGVVLFRSLIALIFCYILYSVFEDRFFFKFNARSLLLEHDISLTDNFRILKNESGGIRDYMHVFELEISGNDKSRLINIIKKSNDYKEEIKNNFDITKQLSRYSNAMIIVNYQDRLNYIRVSYKTYRKGYAPTQDFIKISKAGNILYYCRTE